MPPKCLPGSINNTLLPDCRAAYAAITPADVPPYTHTSTDFDTFPSKRKGSNRATDAVSQPNNRTPIRLMRYFLSIYRLSAGFSSARRQYKVGKKTERGNNSPTARDFSPRNGADTAFRRNPTPTYVADKNKRTHGTNRKTAGKQEAEDMTVSPAFLEFTHEGLLLAFGFFHIMEHVGHVLVFLELLDQLLDRLALLGRHFLRIERNALELTADQIVAVILDESRRRPRTGRI